MRVIVDLVVNYTSNQHGWFQAARHSRGRASRDFYVWSDEIPADGPKGETFPATKGASGRGTPRPGSTTCTVSTVTSLTSTSHHRSRCARRSASSSASGWPGSLGLPRRCRPVPARARRHRRGDGARPARVPAGSAGLPHRRSSEAVLLGEVNLRPPSNAATSATRTATSCTCCSTS